MNKGFGVRKSPKKILDYCGAFRAKGMELPASFTLEEERIPDVRDQGSVNSCVAFSATNIMQVLNQLETGRRDRFSPGYMYGKCRDENDTYQGMIIDNALDYLIKTGSCFEEDFPENLEVPEIMEKARNRPDLDKKAEPYHIRAYEVYASASEERRTNDIKRALYQFKTPLLANTDYFGVLHAVCIIGWDDKTERYTILNSWGKEWGDNGKGTVPYNKIERGYLLVDEKNSDIIMPFTDVPENEWYYKAVQHVYNAGLMNGTSETTFEPEKTMTRAEMAQVLVNLCKKIDDLKS